MINSTNAQSQMAKIAAIEVKLEVLKKAAEN